MRLSMCVRILSNNIAYHALFSFRKDPGSNPACERKLFVSQILISFYIPMKRMSIMMLTSIFLKKYINRKKIQLVVGLNPCPHPHQSCSDPLHHFVTCITNCNIQFLIGLAMGVRILSYTIAYHALLSFRKDPVQIQHVEDIFLLRY